MTEKRIIVPNNSGVSNLDIKRIQKELKTRKAKFETKDCIPAEARNHSIGALKDALKVFDEGKATSMCLVVIQPMNDQASLVSATICCNDYDFEELASITMMALKSRDIDPGAPDGKAG